jgi:hypothetical protein
MHDLFERLGRHLTARFLVVTAQVRESAAIPVLRFYDDAVTATLDRSQKGALQLRPAVDLTGAVETGGASSGLYGLARVPAGFDAAVAISGLLRAVADLTERIGRFTRTDAGTTLHGLIGREGAYTRFMSQPRSPMSAALNAAAPRLSSSVAAIIDTLAGFITAMGGPEGPNRLDTFTEGLAALLQAFPKSDSEVAAEASELTARIGDITRYVGLALLAIPWLSLYLPALFRTAFIGVRLLLLAAAERIEGHVWDFRKALLKLLLVDLEIYRRMGVIYLKTLQQILLSQTAYYIAFLEALLFELISNLSAWATKLTEMFQKIILVVQIVAMIFAALGEAIWPGSTFTTTIVTRASRPSGAGSFMPFPNIVETLLGTGGGNALLQAVRNVKGMTESLIRDLLTAGVGILNATAVNFAALRDVEARVSVAQRFAVVLSDSEKRVGDLMRPEEDLVRQQLDRPRALAGLAAPLESALAAGGFAVIGAAIPGYVKGLRDFWLREKSTGARPTSPHILARHARHLHVRMPDLTIRATGRPADAGLAELVAGRFRAAVDEAYRAGREKYVAAPAG